MTPKKAYTAPKLDRLGTLAEITAAISNKGAADGGSGKNMKT
jgi:hypothetical protein